MAQTAQTHTPDFSGIWRLDDQGSDTPDQLEAALRREARAEQSPPAGQGTPATAGDSTTKPNRTPPGGMGHGGGRGGGMGGSGHRGGRHGGDAGTKEQGKRSPSRYATPSWLDDDGVLIVQQDARGMQVRLDSGTQFALRFNAPPQQALNGSALVRCLPLANGIRVEMTYADGAVLTQDWLRGADGTHLTVRQAWRLPELDRPVTFARSYRKLD